MLLILERFFLYRFSRVQSAAQLLADVQFPRMLRAD